MTPERITGRPVAYPWLCDAMGHLATQHYMAMFDDAAFHFLYEVGSRQEADAARNLGWADVRHEVLYHQEVRAGAVLLILSRPIRIGTKSISSQHRLVNAETGVQHAVLNTTTVRFDLAARRAVPVEPPIRARVESWLIEEGPSE